MVCAFVCLRDRERELEREELAVYSLHFSSFHFKLTDVAGRTGILNILPFASTFHALPWHLLRGR